MPPLEPVTDTHTHTHTHTHTDRHDKYRNPRYAFALRVNDEKVNTASVHYIHVIVILWLQMDIFLVSTEGEM